MRSHVPVNVVVPALDHDDIAVLRHRCRGQTGATTFKVKVAEPGAALADDLSRVATVRAALSEAGVRDPLIRLDANGAWTVAEARRAARMFAAEFGSVLDYFEQPCRTTTELAELRYRLVDDEVDVRIAVDEGLRRARDLYADDLAASLRSAGDVLIVKVAPVGGVARALCAHRGDRPAGRGVRGDEHLGGAVRRAGPGRCGAGPGRRGRPGHRPAARPTTCAPAP